MTGARGQATVEAALALPVVVALLAGLVEVGLVAVDQARLWHAAREAARVAAVDPDPVAARAAAERAGPTPVDVEIDPPARHRVQGEPVTVTLGYRVRPRIPLVGAAVGRLRLAATATMVLEQP